MRDAKERFRSLDRIDPPDVWRRATLLEPVGDVPPAPQPSWQARVAAGAVAFAVFAGVVALVLGAFGSDVVTRPSPAGPAVVPADAIRIVLSVDGNQPVARAEIDGEQVELFGASYCWSEGNSSMCADTTSPTFEDDEIVAIEAGRPLVIEGSADEVSASLLGYPYEPYEDLGALQFDDGIGRFPMEPGRYILSIEASWAQGSRPFYLAFDVVAPDEPTAEPTEAAGPLAPIEVTTPAPGDDVTSPVTIAGTADVFEATVSIQIFDGTNNMIADTFATATCGTGCRGDFSVEVPYSVGSAQQGEIVVFEVSAMDGRRTNVVRIPVTLHPGPQDPVAEAIEGVWTDADGDPLPDGTDRSDGYPLTMHVFEGPDHCGWTSASFVHLAWPLGTVTRTGDDVRQYLRDPEGLFTDVLRSPFGSTGSFPDDAEPTGFSRDGWELWVAPSDEDRAVYGVSGDPRNGGTWERWPRANEMIGCR